MIGEAQTIQPDHDHESHWSFLHDHTLEFCGVALAAIAAVVVAMLKRRKRRY